MFVTVMIPERSYSGELRGEHKVYMALRNGLKGNYRVYCGLHFFNFYENCGPDEGEIDFLIFGNDSLIALEVKGGNEIHYQPLERKWISKDVNGAEHEIKDPFLQAGNAIRNLADKIVASGLFGKDFSRFPFIFAHAVCFPDAVVVSDSFPAHAPRDLFMDMSDLENVNSFISKIAERTKKRFNKTKSLSDSDIKSIEETVIMPELKLVRTLSSRFEESKNEIKRLTIEQFNLLDFLGNRKRALIKGPAGTGKTLLAIEKAKTLSGKGLKVMLLCYNRPLGLKLKKVCEETTVYCDNYHNMVVEWCNEARLSIPPELGDDFWERDCPILLMEASEKLNRKFDAIVIDEGQDFTKDWLESIEALLSSESEGMMFIFYDPEQRIFRREQQIEFPIDDEPYELKFNCRNTKEINRYISKLVKIKSMSPKNAVSGERIEEFYYDSPKNALEIMNSIIDGLLSEGLKPEQITILSPFRRKKSIMADFESIAEIPVEEGDMQSKDGTILFSSIHRFKGLESDVVIICDIHEDSTYCNSNLIYVGASRARFKLYLLKKK